MEHNRFDNGSVDTLRAVASLAGELASLRETYGKTCELYDRMSSELARRHREVLAKHKRIVELEGNLEAAKVHHQALNAKIDELAGRLAETALKKTKGKTK